MTVTLFYTLCRQVIFDLGFRLKKYEMQESTYALRDSIPEGRHGFLISLKRYLDHGDASEEEILAFLDATWPEEEHCCDDRTTELFLVVFA